MKIVGKLFLSPKIKLGQSAIENAPSGRQPALYVRIFSKADQADNRLYLVPDDWDSFRSGEAFFSSEMENYRLLGTISGKKVFLQLKEELCTTCFKPSDKILTVPFRSEGPNPFSAKLILTPGVIGDLFRILGAAAPDEPLSQNSLRSLDRLVFQKLSQPPPDFDDIILTLSDVNIQRLLLSLLHRNIASVEMLAAYIRGLGEKGNVLINNLARGVRQEVSELVRAGRISSTYRWSREVDYIIKRNLMIAVRELGMDVRGMELTVLLRQSYESAVAKEQLSSKSLVEWLEYFREKERLREVMNGVDRRILAGALTFCPAEEINRLFCGVISKDGIHLLKEDVEAARNGTEMEIQKALLKFLRTIKDLYFTPIVKKLDFESETVNGVCDGGALDLIVDETGFAKTAYALKGMPKEWLDKVLNGIFRDIYEDVIGGRILVRNFYDGRIPECRLDFLKALYILSDEEKI